MSHRLAHSHDRFVAENHLCRHIEGDMKDELPSKVPDRAEEAHKILHMFEDIQEQDQVIGGV